MAALMHAPHPAAEARALLAGLFQRSNARHRWRPPTHVLTRCGQQVLRAEVCLRTDEDQVTCPLCLGLRPRGVSTDLP